MAGKYDDLLDLPRPASHHPAMPMADRAAQFGSFAALSGFEQAIDTAAQQFMQAQDPPQEEQSDGYTDLSCDRP